MAAITLFFFFYVLVRVVMLPLSPHVANAFVHQAGYFGEMGSCQLKISHIFQMGVIFQTKENNTKSNNNRDTP